MARIVVDCWSRTHISVGGTVVFFLSPRIHASAPSLWMSLKRMSIFSSLSLVPSIWVRRFLFTRSVLVPNNTVIHNTWHGHTAASGFEPASPSSLFASKRVTTVLLFASAFASLQSRPAAAQDDWHHHRHASGVSIAQQQKIDKEAYPDHRKKKKKKKPAS